MNPMEVLRLKRKLKKQDVDIGLGTLKTMFGFKRAIERGDAEPLKKSLKKVFNDSKARKKLFNELEAFIYYTDVIQNKEGLLQKTQWKKYLLGRSIIRGLYRDMEEDRLSDTYKQKMLDVLIGEIFIGGIAERQKIWGKYKTHNEKVIREGYPEKKIGPLTLLTIDPTEACQLNCLGCYENAYQIKAKSDLRPFEKLKRMDKAPEGMHYLNLETLDWIVDDAMKNLGVHFFVLTGGEPTMYWDFKQKKDIFDFCEKWNDKAYFLMFTNGLRFNNEVAQRMAGIGNILPGISVEGRATIDNFTDERRGKGVGLKISKSMKSLLDAKVPFLSSVTITKDNAEYVSSERFVKWLKNSGALGSFFFQAAAVNKDFDTNYMVTPEQSVMLRKRIWGHVEKLSYFLGDFWSSGDAAATPDAPGGCLAAFRPGGYGTIKSNGQINACVFYPFGPSDPNLNNVNVIKENGGSLVDVVSSPFFQRIRYRQRNFQNDPRFPCCFKHGHPYAVNDVKEFGAISYKTSGDLVNGSDLSKKLTEKANAYKKALLNDEVE